MSGSRAYFNHYGDPPPHDGDLDFLNDDFEYEIAEHFKPRLWCHVEDEECYNSGGHDYPDTLFQVSPIDFENETPKYDFYPMAPGGPGGVGPDNIYLAITYTMLWPDDPGVGGWDYSYLYHDDCADRFTLYCAASCGFQEGFRAAIPCFTSCASMGFSLGACMPMCLPGAMFPDPIFLLCFGWCTAGASMMTNNFDECRCLRPESDFGYLLEPIFDIYTYHELWTGAHFGDNFMLRVFVRSHIRDTGEWDIVGIQNAGNSKVGPESISDCVEFSAGPDDGCHPNVYMSFGKKHSYFFKDDDFGTYSRKAQTQGDECSGDWYSTDTFLVGWMIDPCGESFYKDEMTASYVNLTYPDTPGLYNEVGSNDMHRMGLINYMNSSYMSEEDAWDATHFFCGSGYRYPPDGNRCCFHPYYTWGTEWCDTVTDSQTASPVGEEWLEFDRESNFDGDDFGNRCDKCQHVASINADRDEDGIGDMCDLCPNPDQHPEDIGLPDHEFVYGGRHPCDVFDCSHGIVWLDSADEPPGENALKRLHDFDGDGVGNLCDNCTYVANKNQHNCNEVWERGTRWPSFDGQFREEENIDGDACDPEPCTKTVWETWNLMKIYDNYDPLDIGYYCEGGMGDLPNEYYAYAEIPLDHYGYDLGVGDNDFPRYPDMDHSLRKPVINGYCDCAGILDEELCKLDRNCGEFGQLETDMYGLGWYHLSRMSPADVPENDRDWPTIPPSGASPFTTYRNDFDHNYFRAFHGNDTGQTCYQAVPPAGCNLGDISYLDDTRRSVYWDFINDLGRDPGHYVRLFFKPNDDRFKDAFWPGYIHKNNDYSETYTLMLDCAPFRIRPIEQVPGAGPGEYSPFDSEGCPGPGKYAKLGDKILINAYPCWLESAIVGLWRYEGVKESSATQGIRIVQFDRNAKDFHADYRSFFDSPEDIIDTEGFAAARMTLQVVQHSLGDGAAPSPEDLHEPGTLWVFGGRDKVAYRSDLWRGDPVFIQGGETVFHWTRTTFDTPGAPGGAAPVNAPAGRTGAVLLADPDRNRLVLWGGEGETGPLDDLWVLDISSMTWTQIEKGRRPPALSQFAATQAEGAGYIFGGFDAAGSYSGRIYMMDIETLDFIEIQTEGDVPPPLAGTSLSADPSGKLLYLFGGFDGERWHNWLYALDLAAGRWLMVAGDCDRGTCPYLSSSAAIFGNSYEPSFIVFPGWSESPGVLDYVEEFFSLDPVTGAWEGASAVRGDSARVGDCDGDGTIETGYDALCSMAAGWWNLPGRMVCDTATSSLLCSQEPVEAPPIHEMHRWGVEDIEASGDYLFMTKGSSLVVYDMTRPAAPSQVLDLRLRQDTGDIEIDGGLMAVAAGRKIAILDVSDPPHASILGQAQVCGSVKAIEFYGGSVFYLTRAGIGELDVSDPSVPFTARFAALRRHWDGSWRIDPIGGGCCDGWWPFLSLARPFDVGGGRAFIGAGNDLLVVKITQDSFEVEGKLPLSSWIDELRYDRGLVYLDLFGGGKVAVAARGGEFPSVAGTHDLWDWVEGLPSGGGKVYRLHWNRIQTAVVR